MDSIFNILLEFDHLKVESIIKSTIESGGKGYVCAVEGNILTVAHKNLNYRSIINKSLVNICDGSSIAILANKIYKKRYSNYACADLFINFIKKDNYKFYFLGNTEEVLLELKKKMSKINSKVEEMRFVPLPFIKVEEFDYEEISTSINENEPDVIWVSLGAPKQEEFMSKLEPFIRKGVMIGCGANFNFYSGLYKFRRAPVIFRRIGLEWLFRIFQEPSRISKRAVLYIKVLPSILFNEIKKGN